MAELQFSQIAGMNLHYRMVSLSHFLDSMERHQVKNIELWGGAPHLYSEITTLSQVGKIRKELEKRHFHLVCYTPEQVMYAFNIAAKADDLRRLSLDYFLMNIEIAAELGTPNMLITPGWGYYDEPVQEAWQRSRESLSKLADKAKEKGVTLLFESLQPTESNIVTDLAGAKRMLREVNSPHLVGMLDTVAMAVAGDTIDDYFRAFGEIGHVHLIDGNPSGHLACGDGSLPLKEYLDQLSTRGYSGFLTLEIAASPYLPDPDRAFKRALDHLIGIME